LVDQKARYTLREAIRITSLFLFLNSCDSFFVPSNRRLIRPDFCFKRRTITSLNEKERNYNQKNEDEKKTSDFDAGLKIGSIEEVLRPQENEHQQRLIQELKQAHLEQKRLLELEIEQLTIKLNKRSSQDVLDAAIVMQKELKNEIEILSQKLLKAEFELFNVTELEETMQKKRQGLEEQIAVLQKKLDEGMDWKEKYEKSNMTQSEQEEKLLEEIERLEEEVRAVFSIGRKTSDALVKQMTYELREKEDEMKGAMKELESKDSYIEYLEKERGSLRKLLRISFSLTRERLQSRLLNLRRRISGRVIKPILTSSEGQKNVGENVTVRVRSTNTKTRKSSG